MVAYCLIPILNTRVSPIAIMVERVRGDVRNYTSHDYSAGRITLKNVTGTQSKDKRDTNCKKPPGIHHPCHHHLHPGHHHVADRIDDCNPDHRKRHDKEKGRDRWEDSQKDKNNTCDDPDPPACCTGIK